MSRKNQPGNYFVALAKVFSECEVGDRIFIGFIASIGLLVEIIVIFLSWNMSGEFLRIPLFVILGMSVVCSLGLSLSFGSWHSLTDLYLEKPVNMGRVYNFHVKYIYLPLVVVLCVTSFSEKTKYIDRKLDIQMEMTYKIPEKGKAW